jgi:hypothetical protein
VLSMLLNQLAAIFLALVMIFPPAPFFVHRVDATGTLVPSFLFTIMPSLLSRGSDSRKS